MMEEDRANFLSLRISLVGMLMAAGSVAGAATLLGFLGRYWWFFDLFSHFRMQYLAGLITVGLLLFFVKSRKAAYAAAGLALVNLVIIVPRFFGPGHATDGLLSHRLMLLNVNTRLGSPERVLASIQKHNPDILILEEISSAWTVHLDSLADDYPYSSVMPREDSFGIALYSRLPIVDERIEYIGGAMVPSILATVEAGSTQLHVVATHPVPPAGAQYSGWRNEQLSLLPSYVSGKFPAILAGDLNVTPWNHYFRKLLDDTGMMDGARGRGYRPTWPSYMPLLRIPLDHVLHSPDIVITNMFVGEDTGSDHYPVVADFALSGSAGPRGTDNK
jgi:endonuclease/exonuclease/phosphatase (EEP) superfamily protein YafD